MHRQPEPELMDLRDEAAAYAAADFSAVNAAFVERLLELAGGVAAVRAVDLGTGPADIVIRVARARPGWNIDAVDGAAAMIEIANRAVAAAGVSTRIRLHLADAKHTGLAAGGYDVVFSNSLLHHLPDPLPWWREIRRLGRPGGVIFIRDLFRPASPDAARAIVQQHAGGESELLREEFWRSLLAAFTLEEVREQLAAAGLDGLTVQASSDRHLDVFGPMS
jgi:ubiquinone/menaquinone biosynthesis C-methylase UbiE